MTVALAILASAAIHLGLFFYLQSSARAAPQARETEEITLEVKTVERPKPPPPVEPPKPEKLPARKIPQLVARVDKPPPKEATPPPPNQPPPKEPPRAPPPIRIGINLDSTTPGGDFAAPVGNTLYGQAPDKAPVPSTVAPLAPAWTQHYVPPSRVAELPQLLDEVKAPYPPQARKEGIEGQVVLLITIDENGVVVKVKRITGPGHGLDEAAVEAAKKFRWKPARSNGIAVATDIRYTYSFEID